MNYDVENTFKTNNLAFGTDVASSDKEGKVSLIDKKINAILMSFELILAIPFTYVLIRVLMTDCYMFSFAPNMPIINTNWLHIDKVNMYDAMAEMDAKDV